MMLSPEVCVAETFPVDRFDFATLKPVNESWYILAQTRPIILACLRAGRSECGRGGYILVQEIPRRVGNLLSLAPDRNWQTRQIRSAWHRSRRFGRDLGLGCHALSIFLVQTRRGLGGYIPLPTPPPRDSLSKSSHSMVKLQMGTPIVSIGPRASEPRP
jgi:hypothetical protein